MASTQTGDSPVDQAKEKAQEAGAQAKSRVTQEVDRRSTAVGEQTTSVADAMRQASRQLREQGKDSAAGPMDQVADRVESAGRWLRDSDGDRILSDAEDFGRRNPLAVVAGGLAVGFALSRLLKASSSERYRSRPRTENGLYTGNGAPAPTRGEALPAPPPSPGVVPGA